MIFYYWFGRNKNNAITYIKINYSYFYIDTFIIVLYIRGNYKYKYIIYFFRCFYQEYITKCVVFALLYNAYQISKLYFKKNQFYFVIFIIYEDELITFKGELITHNP